MRNEKVLIRMKDNSEIISFNLEIQRDLELIL